MVGREIRFGFINYVNARVEDGPTPIEGMTLSFLAEHPNAEADLAPYHTYFSYNLVFHISSVPNN